MKLNSGYDLPMIGYGTFGGADAPHLVHDAAKVALECGYRHFDTAYLCKLNREQKGKAKLERGGGSETTYLRGEEYACFFVI